MKHIDFLKTKRFSAGTLCAFFVFCMFPWRSLAQVLPTVGYTATQLATKLAGPGVTISGATLNCASGASGEFTTVVSNLGIDCGVVLTNGQVVTTTGTVKGINIINGLTAGDPSNFANNANSTGGDAELSALVGGATTNDACILEFDFTPIGTSISFDYVFGSEEYTAYTCSEFNDVFGFFISGGSYATPTNIALVPGTSIPVAVNSVNCGPSPDYLTSTACTAMGPGSPFCAYYVNNFSGTTVMYDGFTTVLAATATVTPCVSHHLKLGIADVGDDAFDSGVFLKAGSLTSPVVTEVHTIGFEGMFDMMPYLIRTCNPGKFRFELIPPRCEPTTIFYSVSGSAINGYDYATITNSVVIPAFAASADVDIIPLPLPPSSPKTVTVTVLQPDHCNPATMVPVIPLETATLTIYDTFYLKINTLPDTICSGTSVDLSVTGDPIFGPYMSYTWVPTAGLSNPTILEPVASPTITTTYTIKENLTSLAGCRETDKDIKITVFDKPILTTDSPLVKTCVLVPVQLHVKALPDTLTYLYTWLPPTDLDNNTIFNPTVDPSAPGNTTYTVTVAINFLPTCKKTDTVKVHVIPNNFTLNDDTTICIGQWLQGDANADTEFTLRWRPPVFVSDTTIYNPVITPTVTTTYTVVASYAHCPDTAHSFKLSVEYPPAQQSFLDTICVGMTKFYDVTAMDPGYHHYQWTPATYVSNDTMPAVGITPAVRGDFHYTVGIQGITAACLITDDIELYVLPNTINIATPDTAVCIGKDVQILATGDPAFTYQWRPTAGMAISNVIAPFVTPDTTAEYVVTFSFHTCPDMHDSLLIDVQPTPTVYIGGNRFVCEFDTLRMEAGVTPSWYTHYSYSWTPATAINHVSDQDPLFYNNDTTNVILTVTTPAGCRGVDSALVNVYPGNFAAINPKLDYCPHDTAVLMPTGGASYQWIPSLYISDSMGAQPVIRPITTQTYTVIATDIHGCRDTLTFTATVHPGAVMWMPDSVTLYPGETYQVDPQTNCTKFDWTPAGGLNYKYISNPVASPEVSTRYIVTASTEYGCATRDSIIIHVDPQTLLAVPNAFAPGNGPNNVFRVIKRGIATLNYFRIYNRWGNLVFETTDIDGGWDGTYKGVPQPLGVFVYEVQAVTSTGETFEQHGNITLLR